MDEHDAFGTFDPPTAGAPEWTRPVAAGVERLTSFTVTHRWDHKFARKPDGKRGCAVCGEAKVRLIHHGYPESFNAFGSGANWQAYQSVKKEWSDFLTMAIKRAGLPLGLGYVQVVGRLTFPDRRERDQDNYRYPLSKILGDTLQAGLWLKKDSWKHYEFGNLAEGYERGVAGMDLLFFPSWWSTEEREERRAAEGPGAQASLEL